MGCPLDLYSLNRSRDEIEGHTVQICCINFARGVSLFLQPTIHLRCLGRCFEHLTWSRQRGFPASVRILLFLLDPTMAHRDVVLQGLLASGKPAEVRHHLGIFTVPSFLIPRLSENALRSIVC